MYKTNKEKSNTPVDFRKAELTLVILDNVQSPVTLPPRTTEPSDRFQTNPSCWRPAAVGQSKGWKLNRRRGSRQKETLGI